MRATAIVPIKRFSSAKSRLAETSASALRPALAEAMLTDVLAELGRCERLERIVVVSGEPAAKAIAADLDIDVLDDPDDAGHSEAALVGIDEALAAGAEAVALLPGDCPLVHADEVDSAIDRHEGGLTVIPDRHGTGTNGLLISPPDAVAPSFGPGSRERHLELAAEAGVAARVAEVPSLMLDLDTGEDLARLTEQLESDPAPAPATAAALALLSCT